MMVGVVCWSKLPECRQLKDKKNIQLIIINSYLLKHIGVTIIYAIYVYRKIVALLFSLHTVFVAVIEVQETEKELVK